MKLFFFIFFHWHFPNLKQNILSPNQYSTQAVIWPALDVFDIRQVTQDISEWRVGGGGNQGTFEISIASRTSESFVLHLKQYYHLLIQNNIKSL